MGNTQGMRMYKKNKKTRRSSIDYDTDMDMDAVDCLSNREKELIKKTWNKIELDAERVGAKTFSNLFDMHPNVKDEFIPFKSISTKDDRYTEVLREHGLRVLSTVGKMVDRLDDEDSILPMLTELGTRHGAIYNAKASLISIIGPHFCKSIQVSLAKEWNPELEAAYKHMFDILTYNMKIAMHAATVNFKYIY